MRVGTAIMAADGRHTSKVFVPAGVNQHPAASTSVQVGEKITAGSSWEGRNWHLRRPVAINAELSLTDLKGVDLWKSRPKSLPFPLENTENCTHPRIAHVHTTGPSCKLHHGHRRASCSSSVVWGSPKVAGPCRQMPNLLVTSNGDIMIPAPLDVELSD